MGIFDKLKNKNNIALESPSSPHSPDKVSGIPFPAYKGKKPYIFISYAHIDSSLVYPIISEFHDEGYNVWYDEGIEPGIEWPEEIAKALDHCTLFIVFMTPSAAASCNVRNEINFALSKGVPFIAIHIKKSVLTPGLRLQIGTKQEIRKYEMDEGTFRRKYSSSFETLLKPKANRNPPAQENKPFPYKSGQETVQPFPYKSGQETVQPFPYKSGQETVQPFPYESDQETGQPAGEISPKTDAEHVLFTNSEFKRIVYAELNLKEDTIPTMLQCSQITSLAVCGDAIGKKFNAYTNDGVNVMIVPITGSNDRMMAVKRGSLDHLEDIVNLRNISKLILPFQSIFDMSPLADTRIEELDLSANMLGDLLPIGKMRFLTRLTLNYAQMDSMAPVCNVKSLACLTFMNISQQHFNELCETGNDNLTMLQVNHGKLRSIENIGCFESLENLFIGNTQVTDIRPALSLKHLKKLGIMDLEIPDLSIVKQFPRLSVLNVNEKQKEKISILYGGEFPFKLY